MLVDADNAFNKLNRKVSLESIKRLVAIGKPEWHVRKALHCGSKQ